MQSLVKCIRVSEKASEDGSGEGLGVWEALVQSQVKFNRVQEGSGEGLGGFGEEPGQVQQGSREGSGRLWCRARSG